MATPKELLDDLLKDVKHPEDLLGKNGLLKQLTKDLVERVLEEELTDSLGYEKHAVEGEAPVIPATAKVRKPSKVSKEKFRSISPGIATVNLSCV